MKRSMLSPIIKPSRAKMLKIIKKVLCHLSYFHLKERIRRETVWSALIVSEVAPSNAISLQTGVQICWASGARNDLKNKEGVV